MILISHIIIALSSIVISTLALFLPSKTKLNISYVLVAATLISGTILTIASHSQLIQACTTGLAYLAVITAVLVAAKHRLAYDSSN